MNLPKPSKNGGLPQDFFRRAKRAGKSFVLGFSKKNTDAVATTGQYSDEETYITYYAEAPP